MVKGGFAFSAVSVWAAKDTLGVVTVGVTEALLAG